MNKIPVGQTIAQTYVFAFRNYLQNLGVIWLPLVLFGAAAYYILTPALTALPAFMNDVAQHAQQTPHVPYFPASFGQILRGIFLFEFVALLIMPVLAVGVTRVALGMPRGPSFVYLAVGKREFLVLGGILTLIALYIGVVIAFAVIGGVVGAIVGVIMLSTSDGQAVSAAALATIVTVTRFVTLLLYLGLTYFAVRLCFLMVPVTTAEDRFGVWRSWQLTRGNFWRSLGVILGTFLPVTILTYALWFAAFGPEMFEYWWNVQVHPQLAASNIASMVQAVSGHLPYIGVCLFVVSPINYGLLFGQSAFAYRALAGDETHG